MPDGIQAEARSFFELLNSSQDIRIPIYQRRYAWGKDEIEVLWEDLLESLADPPGEQSLFLGSVVFHGMKNAEGTVTRYLVDGQQRLTTLTMMLGALRHRLLNSESLELGATVGKINQMLFRLDAKTTGQLRPDAPLRMRASRRDGRQFEKLMISNESSDKRAKLYKGWKVIERLIEDSVQERTDRLLLARGIKPDEKPDEVQKARLDALRELTFNLDHVISNVAVFSIIKVEAPFDPLVVFESLNSKNMPLAQSDLIKNLLVQRARTEKEQDQLSETWETLADGLGDDLVRFLRAWYLASYEHITLKQLHNRLQEKITTTAEAERRLQEWADLAPWYLAAKAGAPMTKGSKGLREALYNFSLTGFQQGIPIVLAFVTAGGEKQLPEALHILESVYIRVLRSAQIRGSVFEQRIEEICREVRKSPEGGLENLRDVARALILQYTDGISWKAFRPSKPELQRYVLVRLAQQLEGPVWKAPTPDELEIEHILPQKRPAGHPADPDAYEDMVSHIGNLTLILKGDNASLSNKDPAEKAATYGRYAGASPGLPRLTMTSELSSIGGWGASEIENRAKRLAAVAEKAWPIP